MCVHVMKQKKCHYIGNCSFAHSQEERDVWTYMKNNSCKKHVALSDQSISIFKSTKRVSDLLHLMLCSNIKIVSMQ